MNAAVFARTFKSARRVDMKEGNSGMGTVFFDFGSFDPKHSLTESTLHLTGTAPQRTAMLRAWALEEGYALMALPEESND